ncbi:glycosyltransferase family 4 protein [Streptomyces sp. PA03-1a]|nr:glycosyltransferase family 4 protein [Streptomyces sp. PA03-1a]
MSAVLHVIIPQSEGAIGGSDLHVLDLAVAQQRHGQWQPIVLTLRANRDYLQRLAAAGLSVLAPPLRPGRLWRLPADRDVGMIHGHGYDANYLIAAMRKVSPNWARLPAVATAHGWIENTLRDRVASHWDRLAMRSADLRIASAHAHLPRLQAACGPSVALHNGVPAPGIADGIAFRRAHGIDPDAVLIGSVGRLSPEKRPDLLLKAGARVRQERPDVHLLVVGGGALHEALVQMATALGLDGHVTFTGVVKDISPAMTALDLLVQPSDTEGSPRSILEAMARGLPIVATHVGDVSTLLDDGKAGIIVPPDDPSALTDAILTLISNPTRTQALAATAHARYAELYTVDIMRAKIDDLYETVRSTVSLRRPAPRRLRSKP